MRNVEGDWAARMTRGASMLVLGVALALAPAFAAAQCIAQKLISPCSQMAPNPDIECWTPHGSDTCIHHQAAQDGLTSVGTPTNATCQYKKGTWDPDDPDNCILWVTIYNATVQCQPPAGSVCGGGIGDP